MSKLTYSLMIIVTMFSLSGCTTAVVTGVATGASVLHDRRTAGSVIDDQSIELKAARAIYNDKDLYEKSHINITSYNGIVLLTGEALTEQLKQEVTNKVSKIQKVRKVYNELTISAPSALPSRSSDTWVTSKIKAKYTAEKDLDPFYIKVVTEHGIVYLMGIVSQAEAEKASQIAARSAGVQRVVKIFEYSN